MLRRAAAPGGDLRVVVGAAERLPVRTATFDVVLVVNALHHFEDPQRFLCEAARVLRPGGLLLTVGLDPSRGDDPWYVYDYFPTVRAADRARYPGCATIRTWLEQAGFREPTTELAQRLQERHDARTCLEEGTVGPSATSQLALLSREEYRAGIDRIESDIARADARGETHWLRADLSLYATSARAPGP
jgi:ubiquinone/menaquinone biosynthesis C-methylase UbiE